MVTIVALNVALAAYTGLHLESQPVMMAIASATTAALAILFARFAVAPRHSSVTVTGQTVQSRIPFYGRTIPIDRLNTGRASKVSLRRDDPHQLTWRTNGLGVPGYQVGWFRTRGAGRALAVVTSRDVVTCPTLDGYTLVFSVADRDGFIATLRAASIWTREPSRSVR